MSRFMLGVSAMALCLPAAARAQDVIDLAPITVYGNVTSLPVSRTGATVEIIDEDDLDTAPSQTLDETLATLPGVSFTRNGAAGQTGFVRLRGLPQRYAPVLLNGINITDPTGTQTQFNFGSALQGGLSAVEIVKGSQSALYGSDAVAGIIALTGADAPETPGRFLSLGAEAGSFHTFRSELEAGIATQRAGFAFSAATFDASGPSAIKDGGNVSLFDPLIFASAAPKFPYDEDDAVSGRQFSFDGYVDVTDTIRLGLTGFSQDFDTEFDQGFADFDSGTGAILTDPETGDSELTQKGLRAYAQVETGAVMHTFDISRFTIDRASTNTFGTTDFDGRRDEIGYLGEWDLGGGTVLSFGLDRKTEVADAAPEDVIVRGLFAEIVYAATPDLDLALSVRNDNHSEFGDFNAARGALTWRATPDVTIRASVANGYRAPSLYELYETDFGYGDPSLDPEESVSYDLGVEKTFAGGAVLSATLFKTEIEDLIIFDGTLPPFGRYTQSDGRSTTEGIELAGRLPIGDRLTLSGAFTYTDARDAGDDPALNVPRYDLALGLDAQLTDRISGGLDLRRVADIPATFNASFTSVESVEDFTVVNARAAYTFDNGMEAYLRVENLSDADYEIIPDYNAPGRSAYFGIRAAF